MMIAEILIRHEAQRDGLGHEFLVSVEATLAQLRRFPESAPFILEEIRRASLRRFPYGVFYVFDADVIEVIAVMHAKRNPTRWQERSED